MSGHGYISKEGALDLSYEVGDVIEYRLFGGGIRRVLVSNKERDIKNGKPGFDGTQVGPGTEPYGVWGYDSQILSVEKTSSGRKA